MRGSQDVVLPACPKKRAVTLKRALKRSIKRREADPALCGLQSGDARPDKKRASHIELGSRGEDMAAAFITREGMRVIERNARCRFGEIDIVAEDGDEIVFVEVRTRSVGRLLPPAFTVGPEKLKRLVRSARIWTELRHYEGFWRIDLVAITLSGGTEPLVEHIKGITEGIL